MDSDGRKAQYPPALRHTTGCGLTPQDLDEIYSHPDIVAAAAAYHHVAVEALARSKAWDSERAWEVAEQAAEDADPITETETPAAQGGFGF